MLDKLPPKILIIAEDAIRYNNVYSIISRYWFNVVKCIEPQNLLRILSINTLNMVIINFTNRSKSIKVATKIRQTKGFASIPVIFVLNEEEKKSDYSLKSNNLTEVIYKPVMPNNLMITIKETLRKSHPVFEDRIIKYHFDDNFIKMDLATFQTFRNSKKLKIGPTEFKILELLMKSPNKIFSRRQIVDFVWGCNKSVDERTVDVHVNRLRNSLKISKDSNENIIKTIRHVGYSLSLSQTSGLTSL